MLGLYQFIKEKLWSSSETTSTTSSPIHPSSESCNIPSTNGISVCKDTASGELQQRFFTGVVTSVTSECGMINDHVFFEVDVVLGGMKLEVGDTVHVEAQRKHSRAGWIATRVDVTSRWTEEGGSEVEVLVGFVSGVGGGRGVVSCDEREISFPSDVATSISGYHPHVNDWVKVFLLHQDDVVCVNEIRPLREQTMTGEITYMSQGYGTIQHDIHFTLSACSRDYSPLEGDRVQAHCVEYRHRQKNWRAYHVVLQDSNKEGCVPVKPFKSKFPSIPRPSIPILSPASSGRLLIHSTSINAANINAANINTASTSTTNINAASTSTTNINAASTSTTNINAASTSTSTVPTSASTVPASTSTVPTSSSTITASTNTVATSTTNVSATPLRFIPRSLALKKNSRTPPTSAVSGTSPTSAVSGTPPTSAVSGTPPTSAVSRTPSTNAVSSTSIPSTNSNTVARNTVVSSAVTMDNVSTNSTITMSNVTSSTVTMGNVTTNSTITMSNASISNTITTSTASNYTVATSNPLTLIATPLLCAPQPKTVSTLKGSYREKLAACRLPGQRPVRLYGQKLSNRLKGYPVPSELRVCVEEEGVNDVMAEEPVLEEPLCMDNYGNKFSVLLFLEEIQRERDIRQFDMAMVGMKRCGPYLSLEVPGLAEGRPSLLMGDRAILCETGGDEMSIHWEGYIHEVRSGDVLLKFADSFHEAFDYQEFDVMFTFNRTLFRRMHHAVELGSLIGATTLFPGQPTINPPRAHPYEWFNSQLNSRQKAAVIRILGAQCSPSPYVVFGPPGTGKTVTLVEAILQTRLLVASSRVLVCAPSNSAADLLTERLSQSGHIAPGEMVRLNAIQRPHSMPASILCYCKDTNTADTAARAHIVVATCSTAGYLHGISLGVGHFTHVFVDEAGQATEPECLLPIALLTHSNGQVILAGDPCQLGPVLSSRLASGCGLGMSLLERLMERHTYQRDQKKFGDHGNYDPLLVTKLIQNYRSHKDLLELYSQLFYHGELEVCASPLKSDLLLQWEELPQKGFPLVFHGVIGEDMQEGNSPSWFNPVEALQVIKYVQALKDNTTFAPHLSELGVITPYRKQVEKIRQLLLHLGCGEGGGAGVKVGSVEEFQGQEKAAIIISTVRSSLDLLDFDNRHHLGFLSNPKRFNVAISRACGVLVVVGNPLLISKDPHWSKLLDYAVKNHAYRGCPLP